MNNRFAKTLLATAAVAALAVPVAAQASQGADDPAGHVRQESQAVVAPTSATPSPVAVKKMSDDKGGRRQARRHGRRHGRRADDSAAQRRARGADDNSPATERRGRGTDDGPNHS